MMPTPVMDVVIVPLYVVAQGHPGRHPDVEPTDTSATGAGHEDQRATVERQVWLKLGKLGVTGLPRFTGGDQASCTLGRVDVQRSNWLTPPGRPELKNISLPSRRTDGNPSGTFGALSSEISATGPRASPWRVTGAE